MWAGISWNGRTSIVIFEGKLNTYDILSKALLPFIESKYPNGHRLMADNDPKHTSNCAREFIEDTGINWWRTPAESPDLNPIQNMWHELKEYLRREVKPRTKDQLVNGIEMFWKSVDVRKCRKYIRHLRKVFPSIIQREGGATGY